MSIHSVLCPDLPGNSRRIAVESGRWLGASEESNDSIASGKLHLIKILVFVLTQLILCGTAYAEPGGDKSPVLSEDEVERQVFKELSAGRQKKAEKLLDDYAERYRNVQWIVFLRAACLRSRFEVQGASALFREVLEIDEESVYGQCAWHMLMLDAAKDIDEHIAALRELADDNPDVIMLRWMAAVQCRTFDKNIEGIGHYKKILAVWDPGPVLVHQTYANLLGEVGRYKEALVERRIAVKLEPAGWSYHGLGSTLASMKRFAEADEAFEKAVELDPENVTSWRLWAIYLYRQGRFDEAALKCEKALTVDEGNWKAWKLLGNINWKMKDIEEAIVNYTKAIEHNPRFAKAYCDRGGAYYYIKEYDKAIADYSEAIRLDPNFFEAYSGRAGVYRKKKEYDKAIADSTKAIQLNPKLGRMFDFRAFVYMRKGMYDKVVSDCTAAIRLNPKHARAYNLRGVAYRLQGNYDKAITDFSESIRHDPNNVLAFYNRGFAYLWKGNIDQAIADETEAIRLDPKYADAYCTRGAAYLRKGDLDRAIVDETEAIRLNPKNAEAYHHRGVAYEKKGESSKSKADLKQAKKLKNKREEPRKRG